MSGRIKPDTTYLTGIRGFAALIVVFGHASNAGMHIIPGVDLHATAKAGVWLFFVLSAYLLTNKLWLDFEAKNPRSAIRSYALKRLARIMPLYLVFLLVMWALGQFSAEGAWQHALLMRGDLHLWTIPVEMAFYLVLPVLLLLMKSRQSAFIVLAVSIIAYLAYDPSAVEENTILLPNYMVFFAAGMTLALIEPPKLTNKAANLIVLISLASMVTLSPRFLMWLFGLSQTNALGYSILFALPWVALIYASATSSLFNALFSSWPLVFIGKISFGLYLFHYPIFEFVRNERPDLVADPLLVTGFAVAMATSTYYLIEEPILRWASGRHRASSIRSPQRVTDTRR